MSPRTTRQRVPALIAVVILIGMLGGTLVTQRGGAGDPAAATTSTTSSTTTTTVPTTTTVLDPSTLGAEGQELYALAQAGRASQYHVRFQLSGESLPPTATSAFLDIWRSGPDIRQDTWLEETTGVTHGVNLGSPDGTVSCQEQPGLSLSCRRTSSDPVSPEDDFLSTIMVRLSTADIAVTDEELVGIPARCFVLDGDSATDRAELCLTATGVPLRVSVAGLAAEALEVQEQVDPATFTPPAAVSGPTEETTVSTSMDTTVTPDSSR